MATALQAYPFDSVDTTEAQYGRLFGLLQDDGIADLPTSASGQVTAGGGLSVNVASFPAAYLSGGIAALASAATVALDVAAAQTRIDRIVVRVDWTSNTAVLDKLSGVAGAGVPKALTQVKGGIYEISLARITVPAGAVNIAASNITDEREFISQRVLAYAASNRPDAATVGVALGLNYTTKRLEISDGSTWSTVGGETPTAGVLGYPGTVVDVADSGGYKSSITRAGGRATLVMNLNIGTNGINSTIARLILGVPSGFRPPSPTGGKADPHFVCQVSVNGSYTGVAGFQIIALNGQVLFNWYSGGAALPANAHVHGTVTYDIGG